MRVLMLLSNPYLPDARVYREAKTLISKGYEVTVLAWDRENSHRPEENMEGIRVLRTGPKFRGKRYFISDIRRFWKDAESISKSLNFDIIHAHDFDTLPLAVRIKKKKDEPLPLIFDAHETYSEMIRIDVPSFVASMVQRLEDHYLKYVDRIITVNEHQRSFYSERVGKDRVVVVMNAKPALKEIRRAMEIRRKLGIGDDIALIYIGALESERFVKELTDIAGKIENVRIIIGGYGSLKGYVEEKSENEGLTYLGFVHPDEVIDYSAAADMIVGMYKEVQTDRIATKFFDAVAAGRGLIVADNGEKTAELVRRYGGGVVCDYSKEAFIKAVRTLDKEKIEKMGNNMKKLRSKYSWEAMEKRLIALYDSITSS